MGTDGSSTLTRALGVIASALLAIGTFGALGLALLQTLYQRGMVGHRGSQQTDPIAYIGPGVIGGTVVGVVVAVWVGLRVWHRQWTLLMLLVALACVTAVTLAIASSA
jgi:hypothetical protein